MSDVMLIIAYVVIIEIAAIWLNRFIIRNSDMNANTYLFNVRYNGFSIFFSMIMCGSLIAFAYLVITRSGSFDSRSITIIILLAIGLIELVKKVFFKIEIANSLINFKSITKRTNLTFSDINKIEITTVLGLAVADVYSNDKKMFTVNNMMAGYNLMIDRLKIEDVEWV